MLAELQPNYEKLIAAAIATDDSVARMVAETLQGTLTTKSSRRLAMSVESKLSELRGSTHGGLAQFVKLSYLRSARQVDEKYKLGDADNSYIEDLIQWADWQMLGLKSDIGRSIDRVIRQATISKTAREPVSAVPVNETFAQALDRIRSRPWLDAENALAAVLEKVSDTAERAGQAAVEVTA